MNNFSDLFDKVLYMFRTGSTVQHQQYLNTVYTAIGICHASSVGSLLTSILTTLADANRTGMTNTYCYVYSVEILLMMDSGPVRNM